ncbi:hypothetical protein O9K51_04051 [Purpureocillium lavendulum]|uniref:Uncharacterized protein n=1 Tax=Purpureocillium lavendulum TaxID=1247861 RepID=A0AB34FXX2_9HYPO|nr:hypothetical protein O9K51_04051 [Purpureocillium lavendulum]
MQAGLMQARGAGGGSKLRRGRLWGGPNNDDVVVPWCNGRGARHEAVEGERRDLAFGVLLRAPSSSSVGRRRRRSGRGSRLLGGCRWVHAGRSLAPAAARRGPRETGAAATLRQETRGKGAGSGQQAAVSRRLREVAQHSGAAEAMKEEKEEEEGQGDEGKEVGAGAREERGTARQGKARRGEARPRTGGKGRDDRDGT